MGPTLSKDTILIIDDDISNINSLQSILEDEYAVVTMSAQDAENDITDIVDNFPALIVISTQNRFQLVEQFNENKLTSRIPILCIAEQIDEVEAARLATEGIVDFIEKPFSSPIVKLRIKNHLTFAQYLYYQEEMLLQHKSRMKETLDVLNAQKEKDFRQAALVHTGRLASLGEMATSMAHEISQPLNVISIAIQGWQLLDERDLLDNERVLKTIPVLLNNVERISFLIDHVRTLGHCSRENREINICDVLKNTLSLCRKQLDNAGIFVESQISEDLPPVFAVESEVEQVALNLLSNSRCALEAHKGSMESDPHIKVSCYAEGGMVCIEIEDNGGGVNPADEDKIFNPFFSTKEPGKGTGLGLSICKQIIEKYRGSLTLHNTPGDGVRFKVALPKVI
jgi:C4-dicarboxylate-specific signal transduction histidine kinase